MKKSLCIKSIEGMFVEGANYRVDYDETRSEATRYLVYSTDEEFVTMSEEEFGRNFTLDFEI
jgi:hypothetical protein